MVETGGSLPRCSRGVLAVKVMLEQPPEGGGGEAGCLTDICRKSV